MFLSWLDPYIKKRQTTSNLLIDLSHEDSDTPDDCNLVDQHSDVSDFDTSSNSSSKRDDSVSETTGQIKYRKR